MERVGSKFTDTASSFQRLAGFSSRPIFACGKTEQSACVSVSQICSPLKGGFKEGMI